MLAPEAKLGSAPAHPLHVVIFLVDDLGYGDTHHMGAEYDTPHISSLALGGVRLNQSYAAMLCSPSRASLLSSRYAYRVGMDGEVLKQGDERCSNVTTLGKQMKRFGMHTASGVLRPGAGLLLTRDWVGELRLPRELCPGTAVPRRVQHAPVRPQGDRVDSQDDECTRRSLDLPLLFVAGRPHAD